MVSRNEMGQPDAHVILVDTINTDRDLYEDVTGAIWSMPNSIDAGTLGVTRISQTLEDGTYAADYHTVESTERRATLMISSPACRTAPTDFFMWGHTPGSLATITKPGLFHPILGCGANQSIPQGRIEKIIRTEGDTLWFATDSGIYRYNYQTQAWSRLDDEDGLLSSEFADADGRP